MSSISMFLHVLCFHSTALVALNIFLHTGVVITHMKLFIFIYFIFFHWSRTTNMWFCITMANLQAHSSGDCDCEERWGRWGGGWAVSIRHHTDRVPPGTVADPNQPCWNGGSWLSSKKLTFKKWLTLAQCALLLCSLCESNSGLALLKCTTFLSFVRPDALLVFAAFDS